MTANKRFRKVMGFIQDNACEGGDVGGVMDLTEIEDKLNELNDENKELKYKLRNCEDARKSYKQDWKACSSYCDEYKNEIISLKDEVEGLIGENKEFKKENEQLQTELNNYEKITNLLADYDVHHYNRWINQIKNYVEKTNEGFEYNREFIIKLCLSYTLQSLRNGEDLKRFQWGMVNDE